MAPPATVRTSAIAAALQRWCGFTELRPMQREAIDAALDARDALVVMPTGGGKALCYQLPALLQDRLVVVVSPLIALMQDQVDGLRLLGVPAAPVRGKPVGRDQVGLACDGRRWLAARGGEVSYETPRLVSAHLVMRAGRKEARAGRQPPRAGISSCLLPTLYAAAGKTRSRSTSVVHCTRRSFLIEVGRGMITASVGLSAASQLAMASSFAVQDPEPLEFGPLEPLVGLLTDTPANMLMRTLVEKLRTGTSLRELATAGALANARTFGGHDYVGFHTMMALAPAYRMSLATPEATRPLPLLKVLYRNTHRIQEFGGRSKEVLRTVAPAPLPEGRPGGEVLRDAVRAGDMATAEGTFAALSRNTPEAFNALLEAVQDGYDVHRVVMPHRAWDLLDVIGSEYAHTLLRQSVHYCVKNERQTKERSTDARALLPRLLEQHKLLGKTPGTRVADDAWIESTSQLFFREKPEVAADAAAAALAEGWAPECVGDAIALATNQLLLRDPGRTGKQADAKKPEGSVHGDSIGVHACDSANAWRGMARAGNARNTFASLILGAFQAATDRVDRGGDFLAWQPWPLPQHLAVIAPEDPGELVTATETAIRSNDQARACALVHRYGERGQPEGPVVDLLLRYATSEDGALHAEKYFRTAVEEFKVARPAFRWRHLCALARVTASEFGTPAPGYAEALASLRA